MNNNFISVKGTALFPHLRTPEEYQGSEIGYTIKLSPSAEDVIKMEKVLRNELAKAATLPEFSGKGLDSEDAYIGKGETNNGEVFFKFKTKASYINRNGERVERKVPIFDTEGNMIPDDVNVGHGSIVRVAYTPRPYYKSKRIKGITLYLNAVQVIQLKSFTQGADSFGFDTEGGGFVVDTNTNSDTFADSGFNDEVDF